MKKNIFIDKAKNLLKDMHARLWEKKLVSPPTALAKMIDEMATVFEKANQNKLDATLYEAKKIITQISTRMLIAKIIKFGLTKPEHKEYFKKLLAKLFDKELEAVLEDVLQVWHGEILSYLHGKKQIEDDRLNATNQKIRFKPDGNNRQIWFNFNGEKSEYKITKTGITATTSDKNKNEIKQIEFSAILKDPRFLIYALSKLQKDKNAETDVRIDIDVKEYQKMRMISRKEAKKQIEEQVPMLLNA
jgi:hypothetical protein